MSSSDWGCAGRWAPIVFSWNRTQSVVVYTSYQYCSCKLKECLGTWIECNSHSISQVHLVLAAAAAMQPQHCRHHACVAISLSQQTYVDGHQHVQMTKNSHNNAKFVAVYLACWSRASLITCRLTHGSGRLYTIAVHSTGSLADMHSSCMLASAEAR